MFIKSGAIISEVFNIAKAQKNSGPQEMFSKSACLVYPLTLFRASTVHSLSSMKTPIWKHGPIGGRRTYRLSWEKRCILVQSCHIMSLYYVIYRSHVLAHLTSSSRHDFICCHVLGWDIGQWPMVHLWEHRRLWLWARAECPRHLLIGRSSR